MQRKESNVIMEYKLVADSSANILTLTGAKFDSASMHIIVGEQEFVDDENIDVKQMQAAIDAHGGKTQTACPGPDAWITAFGEADAVFCVTITSHLSGSYNAAMSAKGIYESEHPGRKVYVLDSLSTGPEMILILEKLRELIDQNLEPEDIHQKIQEYMKSTHLFFSLASLKNLANNGRVNSLVAKGIGVLGIKIVGRASSEGELEPMHKCRGDKRAFPCLVDMMKDSGYQGGKIIIAHNDNSQGALQLKNEILTALGERTIPIHSTRGLCSYYAEPGSVLVGFEA